MNDSHRKVAAATWQAYNAMETTKQRHFDFLTVLENKKKKFNIDPTDVDTQLLATLLRDHDEQVAEFTRSSQALKEHDPTAHQALFVYIGEIARQLEGLKPAH